MLGDWTVLGCACVGVCIVADSTARWAALFSGCPLFLKGLVLLLLWAGFKPRKPVFSFFLRLWSNSNWRLGNEGKPRNEWGEMHLHTHRWLLCSAALPVGLGSSLCCFSQEGQGPWLCTWRVNSHYWCSYTSLLPLFAVSVFPKFH